MPAHCSRRSRIGKAPQVFHTLLYGDIRRLAPVNTAVYGGCRRERSMTDQLSATDWLDQGLRTLAKSGFTALKAEPLAKAMGVSRGSFYWHFADIGAYHAAILRHWRDVAAEQIIKAGLRKTKIPCCSCCAGPSAANRRWRTPSAPGPRSIRWRGAPMPEDRSVISADIGEMPVKAAARHPHCPGQRLGFQRREAAFGQRPKALIEPVFCGELIGHVLPCDNPPYTAVESASVSVIPHHTVMYGRSWTEPCRCATCCCNVRGSLRSRWPSFMVCWAKPGYSRAPPSSRRGCAT